MASRYLVSTFVLHLVGYCCLVSPCILRGHIDGAVVAGYGCLVVANLVDVIRWLRSGRG